MPDVKTIKILLEQGVFFFCFIIMLFWLIRYYVPKTIESNLAIANNIKDLVKINRANTRAIMIMLHELGMQLTWTEAKSTGLNNLSDEEIKGSIKDLLRRSEEQSQRTRESIEQIFKE